ncbi:uncharacterized protein FA14DRAFT_176886 [Meira miltonrushii]|uniref:Uncharacterized protein n=1 Tax=Meira miltonrushii TaxID=1280837 RepID=A0A316VIV3_9BASI|nr:uncharacterized protein FA14DRAFT_176886 [Meira miltonrushii]PWN37597.1 hypothetical protein FA14DRAFT_176886 [Meira miltonrushii]
MRFNASFLLVFTVLAVAGVMADDAVPSGLSNSTPAKDTPVPVPNDQQSSTTPTDGNPQRDTSAPVGSDTNPAPTDIRPIGGDSSKDKKGSSDPVGSDTNPAPTDIKPIGGDPSKDKKDNSDPVGRQRIRYN